MQNSLINILSNSSLENNSIQAAASSIANTFNDDEVKELFSTKKFLNDFRLFLLRKKNTISEELPALFDSLIEYANDGQEKNKNVFLCVLKEVILFSPSDFVKIACEIISKPNTQQILTEIFNLEAHFCGDFEEKKFVEAIKSVENPTNEFIAAATKYATNFVPDFTEEIFESPLKKLQKENERLKDFILTQNDELERNKQSLNDLKSILNEESIKKKEECEEMINKLIFGIESKQEAIHIMKIDNETAKLKRIIREMKQTIEAFAEEKEENLLTLKVNNSRLKKTITDMKEKVKEVEDEKVAELKKLLFKNDEEEESPEEEETPENLTKQNESLAKILSEAKERIKELSIEEKEELSLEDSEAEHFKLSSIIKDMKECLEEEEDFDEQQRYKEMINKLREDISKAECKENTENHNIESEKRLKNEIRRLTIDNQEKEQIIEAMKEEAENKNIKNLIKSAGSNLSSLKNMIINKKQVCDPKENEYLRSELADRDTEIDDLKQEIETLQESISKKEKEMEDLEAKSKEESERNEKEISELNEKESKLKSEVDSLTNQLEESNSNIEKIKEETDAIIGELRESVEKTKGANEEGERENEEKIKNLEEKLTEMENLMEEKEKEHAEAISKKEEEYAKLEVELENLKVHNEMEAKLKEQEEARAKVQAAIDTTLNESKRKREGDFLKLEMKLKKEEKKHKKDVEELQSQIDELQAYIDEYSNQEPPLLVNSEIEEIIDIEPSFDEEIAQEQQFILPPTYPRRPQEVPTNDNKRKPKQKKNVTVFSKLFYHVL